MKIAYLVHDFRRFEGQGRYTVELATRFSENHDVHVFANYVPEDEKARNIHFHHVPCSRANALATVVTFAAGIPLVLRDQFDIVHGQGFCAFRGNLLTAHICNQAWHAALERSSGRLMPKQRVYGEITRFLERKVYRSSRLRKVIAVSERVSRDLRSNYGCTAPIEIIRHGVDLERFHPRNRSVMRCAVRRELGLTDKMFTFVFVGDLRKGAAHCVKALAECPEAGLILVSRSEFGPYRDQAVKLDVSDRVRFVDATRQVERYYAAADAFLLPTPYDAFAMVVTEAMASGLPVAVSREAGASELITDRVNGLLLKQHDDVAALAESMNLLRTDADLADRLGNCARGTVEKYSWDTVADQTLKVYESVARH